MARYRSKGKTDKVWNRIRRHITGEVNMAFADAREEVLDKLLTQAWSEYNQAVGEGRIPEVESKYKHLVDAVLTDIIPAEDRIIEGTDAEVD